jgi:hypothetical protein
MRKDCARRALVAMVLTTIVAGAGARDAYAQNRPGRARGMDVPPALGEGGVSPAEIQRLFDAYAVMQAQTELQLSDEQYPRFMTRVRALQDARRRGLMERGRILQELRRLSGPQAGDETAVRAALKRLADLETKTLADVRQAMDAVDQVLDTRQQARYRVFEDQMERRKVELLLRARQGRRAPQ